jgi:hypothetical protein
MRAAPLGLGLLVALLEFPLACSTSSLGPPPGVYTSPLAWGSCDVDYAYAAITTYSFCGDAFPACAGVTYAVCNGSQWYGCDCFADGLPAGYSVIRDPNYGEGPGGDGDGTPEGGLGEGGTAESDGGDNSTEDAMGSEDADDGGTAEGGGSTEDCGDM